MGNDESTLGTASAAALVAEGDTSAERLHRPLAPGETFLLGRGTGRFAAWWDHQISREHARCHFDGQVLIVEALPQASNPLVYRGQGRRTISLEAGDYFVIGRTKFHLVEPPLDLTSRVDQPELERAYQPLPISSDRPHGETRRMAALARLPDLVRTAGGEREMAVRLLDWLLAAIAAAEEVAVFARKTTETPQLTDAPVPLAVERSRGSASGTDLTMLTFDRRRIGQEPFRPNRSILDRAWQTRQSVLQFWRPTPVGPGERRWAIATPVITAPDAGWVIYVSGSTESAASEAQTSNRSLAVEIPPAHIDPALPSPDPDTGKSSGTNQRASAPAFSEDRARLTVDSSRPNRPRVDAAAAGLTRWADAISEDVRLIELAAAQIEAFAEVRRLERRAASLRPFFSPPVLEALTAAEAEDVLAPRETDLCVLFCDLRGFTRLAENMADDLPGLLAEVSRVLGVTTEAILDAGGVIGDFHGDAVMGFWGWPLPQHDRAVRGCRAALQIVERLASERGPLPVGVGLAAGRAVAGRIGTADQVKVTALGPVVNRAARFETMTSLIGASILIDPTVAAEVSAQEPSFRLRAVAKVIPVGLNEPVLVTELLPTQSIAPGPSKSPGSGSMVLTTETLDAYAEGLAAFEIGNWDQAIESLQTVPATDRVKDLIISYITRHRRRVPPGFTGVIPLAEKG